VTVGPLRVLVPTRWCIEICRVGDNRYRMVYVEEIEKPNNMSDDEFRRAIENTANFVKTALENIAQVTYEVEGSGKVRFRIEVEDQLHLIADLLVGEFLPHTTLGNLRLVDIATLAGLQVLKALKSDTKQVKTCLSPGRGDHQE